MVSHDSCPLNFTDFHHLNPTVFFSVHGESITNGNVHHLSIQQAKENHTIVVENQATIVKNGSQLLVMKTLPF